MRLLRGETDTLRVEVPGDDKADFVVSAGTRREAHQVKRSHPAGKWRFAALRADGLIRHIGEYLENDDNHFVFTSGSEARELWELVQAGTDAESLEEFAREFLGETKRKERFTHLVDDWNCDTKSALDRLRRIDLRVINERELQDKVRWAADALFLADPERVLTELRAIAEDSVHRTITRQWLGEELSRRGFRVRRLNNPQAAARVVEETTDRYLDAARRRLIRNALVPRSAATTLLARLDGISSDSVITGTAGGGKTACVVEVVDGLRARGQPVLVFRLDRIPSSVRTATDLGGHLGLEESPVLVLAASAEATGRPGVLIVDQLDAVSTMSGRNSAAFDLVERLIKEARGMGETATIHTVVVCRSFDWKNDSGLRSLLPRDHDQVEVTGFHSAEVKTILKQAGFDPVLFQDRQLKLLQRPQNLSLFLEAGFDQSLAPAFHTATKLFDEYWETKRCAVAEIAAQDHWMSVIEKLCDEMNATQLLSVPRERLDSIPPVYLRQVASEGVLTYDGHRYGFGHESFFDYCFARVFVNRPGQITSFLRSSEQHLFRRAQVRQVLTYLRDADRDRYLRELDELLSDPGIRAHVKDLAFALLADVPDPTNEEWAIWRRWTTGVIQAIASGTQSHDRLALLAWRRFFASPSWFVETDRRGTIQDWLAAAPDQLADMAVNYLWAHHSHAPDRVAALLEPYADCAGKWPDRLRSLMEKTQHHTSRRYFDLLLRLVDNGTMDIINRDVVKNDTIWQVLYGVGENRNEWIPEAVARFLQRRLAVTRTDGKDIGASGLIGFDETAAGVFHSSARHAPSQFVRHLLPLFLDISDSTLLAGTPPKYDAVWGIPFKTEHPKGETALLLALSEALNEIASERHADLPGIIHELRRRDTYVANFLLQSVYRAAASQFADEAVSTLCGQPWRFRCGYNDSPYWSTMELIKAVILHCKSHNLERLDTAILSYVGPFERPTAEQRRAGIRYNWIGRTSFCLLSSIPKELRSARANRYFGELERRFGAPDGPPKGIVGGLVPSPIADTLAGKMTDEQWRRAIAKYHREEPTFFSTGSGGGAHQLSQVLEKFVKDDPCRFARLGLTFPADANPVYLARILDGLRDASVETDLKLQVCRKAYTDSRRSCGKSIADVLGRVEEPLPPDAVEMLLWLATEHKDPDKELWQRPADGGQPHYNGEVYTSGINSARGRAAEAIQRLILIDASYIRRFRPAIDMMVGDRSSAVRSCVAGVLRAVAFHDPALGMSLFQSMHLSEDRLLATVHVYGFIHNYLGDGFLDLRPIVKRMLHSAEPEVCKAGAALASLAAMLHESAADLGEEALQGTAHQRFGMAKIVAANIAVPRFRAWCEPRLVTLFDDNDDPVRQETTKCFSDLPDDTLDSYSEVIEAFCNSRAFAGGAFWLIQALEKSRGRLPGMTCMVCERTLDAPSRDVHGATKLIFRTYQQHQEDEWASQALDLIDRLCLEGDPILGSEFEEFER